MSNLVVRHRIAAASGGPTMTMQLTGPAAWAAPGGSNASSLATTAGDLRLTSAGGNGLVVMGATGYVGIGFGIGAPTSPVAALDVSGGIHATTATFSMMTTSNLSIIGSFETVNAYETHSSNVTITNQGTGPALVVTQALSMQPVANFYSGNNIALLVDGAGRVAIGKTTANAALDVSGVSVFTSNVGIGKTNPAFSLDVSGSVNATSIVVGGSTAKQIDCGSIATNGAMNLVVSFNFTFNNIPKVVCSINFDWGNAIVTSYTLHNISTTGFLVNAVWIGAGASMGNISGATLTWIAIG